MSTFPGSLQVYAYWLELMAKFCGNLLAVEQKGYFTIITLILGRMFYSITDRFVHRLNCIPEFVPNY